MQPFWEFLLFNSSLITETKDATKRKGSFSIPILFLDGGKYQRKRNANTLSFSRPVLAGGVHFTFKEFEISNIFCGVISPFLDEGNLSGWWRKICVR